MKRIYKNLLIPVLLLSTIDVYAACRLSGVDYNEAGRAGAGVTVVTGTAGGFVTKADIQTWTLDDNITTCDVSQITDMSELFTAQGDFNQDISSWDVSSVTTMQGMFMLASIFNQDISNWDVSSVTNMATMFENATMFNQDISGWNVSSVVDMTAMFFRASSFDQNLGSWNVSNVSSMSLMFVVTSLSSDNYDEILVGWSQLSLKTGVTLEVTGVQYTAVSARNVLTTTYSWTILDDGQGADISTPSITITSSTVTSGASSSDASIALIFTLSEGSSNFAQADITVTNGSLSSFSKTSSKIYTATFTPTASGLTTIDVAANTFTDYAGNDNTAGTQFTWTYTGGSSDPGESSDPTDPTEKAEVKSSIIAMSHIVTNFAQTNQTVIENRLQWLSRQKNNTKTSYQGIKFKFANPILNKIANNKAEFTRPDLNQMVNGVNQDHDILAASKQMITSDATDLLISEAAKVKNEYIGTLNPVFKAIDGWSVWTAGQITIGKVKGNSTSSESDIDDQMLSIGLDRKNKYGLVGYMLSVGQARADIKGNASEIKSDNYSLATYRSYLYETRSLDVMTGVSLFKMDTVRIDGSDRLEGRRDVRQIYLMTKYNDHKIKLNHFTLTPYGRVSLAYSELKAFSESGASTALHYKKQSISDTLLSVGADINFNKNYKHGTLSPYALAEYSVDVGDSSTADMYYVGQSTEYSLRINKKATSIYKLGVGADYQSNNGLISSLYYERAQAINSGHNDKLNLSINFKF